MPTPFRVATETLADGVVVVNVAGEVDQATVPTLRSALDDAIGGDAPGLLVDLSDCEFIDSSGLGALVSARERFVAQDSRRFGICCPNSQVRRLLEITGLDEAMGLVASRDDALAALGVDAEGPGG